VAGGVALLAFSVRIDGALHFALWQDEVGSAQAIVESTPLGVARHVARSESHPPAFFLLGWFAHRLGFSIEAVRTVSVLAGALLSGGLVLYARRLVPLWTSALAGLSVALGYQFVFHGRELRSYELHALLCLALAFAALAFVRTPDRARAVALALVVALGALTNYFFLLAVATVVVWCWISPIARPARRAATWAITAGLVPFAAWVPVMVVQYGHRGAYTYIGSFHLHAVLTTYWDEFVRSQPDTVVLHEVAPWLLLMGVLVGCAQLARGSDAGRLTAMLAILPLILAGSIWLAGADIYDVRNMIGVGPFAAVALAALVSSLQVRIAALTACLAAALIVFGFVRGDRVPPVAYDRVAHALVAEGWKPSDAIVLGGNFYAFRSTLEWYLPGRPALTLGEWASSACPRLFVVATGGSALYRMLSTSFLPTTRHVRGIVVARLDSNEVRPMRQLPRGTHLLVATNAHSPCGRAVPEGRINARL